jgi:hypothetical protein
MIVTGLERQAGERSRLFAPGLALLAFLGAAPAAHAAGEPAIVFVSRQFQRAPDIPTRSQAVELAADGKLRVHHSDGRMVTLVDAAAPGSAPETPIDVADPDVSFSGLYADGPRIVFSGFSPLEGAWRIYEIRADGTGLRQVTRSDRALDAASYGAAAAKFQGHDDLDPCYLPDGRIGFVSTRYPGAAPGGRVRATNLYAVNADGTGLRRLTTERFGADTPAVDPESGRIVYSRWWITSMPTPPPSGGPNPVRPPAYYGPVANANNFSTIVLRGIADEDFPGVNNWSLAAVNPDGTGLTMFSGTALDRERTMAYRPSFGPRGELVSLFILQSPLLGVPGDHGLRRNHRGPSLPEALGGPQNFQGTAEMTPFNPAEPIDRFRSPGFVYASAEFLPDGRLLVAGRASDASDGLAPGRNFDIFVQSDSGAPALLFGDPSRMELDAVPLVERPRPPIHEAKAPAIIEERTYRSPQAAIEAHGSFTFLVENIHFNAPVDVPVAHAPPIGRELTIEFYMNPQREGGLERPDPPILVGSRRIGPDGRVEMELPAGVPLFEILRRADGRIALGRDGQAFHVGGMNFGHAGTTARCVGCHAGHSQVPVPEDFRWTNVAPSAATSASSTLREPNGRFSTVQRSPALLVDRRTDELSSEWAADPLDSRPELRLRWQLPIRAREAVVYAVRPGSSPSFGARDLVVGKYTVRTSLDGGSQTVQEIVVETPIQVSGSRIALDAELAFDTLSVRFDRDAISGAYLGALTPALAEIEVIAEVAGESESAKSYFLVRGDANCDGNLNLTDAIAMLNTLFQGAGPFCCEAAADANGDGRINLTDAVVALDYLFRFTAPLPAPFPDCGRVPAKGFGCDQEPCF